MKELTIIILQATANERISLEVLQNYASNLKASTSSSFRVIGQYELPSLKQYGFQG